MTQLFDDAEVIIKSIAQDCVRSATDLQSALDALRKVSCSADAAGKSDAFDRANGAIDQAYIDCPSHGKDLDALRDLLSQGMSVKCSGG